MRIDIRQFDGIVPRTAPELLADTQAQIAQNCDLSGGYLRVLSEPSVVTSIPLDQQSLYLYGTTWLTWGTDVDVVKSPVILDQYDRIYYTGDGTPKVRSGTDEYDLGLPSPATAPTVTVQAKTATTWTREWHYFYEEPDGTQKDNGTLTEGVDITETTPGKGYTVPVIPAKVAASANATFVLWFKGYADDGAYLGILYPDISKYANNTDLYIDGAQTSGAQENGATAVLTLEYNTTQAGDYTVERSYVHTFVSAWGEEGPPSPASVIVAVDPSQDALIAGMDTSVSGNVNVTKKRIYRTVTGESGTFFRFVAEVDISAATFLDTLADSATGEVIPSSDWDAPPAALTGLVAMPGGFMAGFSGKDVYFSVPYQPHAWPAEYISTVDYEIVGLGVSGNSLVVTTAGRPFIITGVEPSTMTQTRIPINQACVSKRSIANIGEIVLYVSPDGIVAINSGNGQLVSERYYRYYQWKELSPETMIGEVHDRRYYLFGDEINLVFDVGEGRSQLVTHDESADGAYTDLETDTLYLIQDANIVSWDSGDAKTATWKSREFFAQRAVYFSCARVLADNYPVTMEVYTDLALATTVEVENSQAFRLPSIPRGKRWSISVSSQYDAREALISTSMRDL